MDIEPMPDTLWMTLGNPLFSRNIIFVHDFVMTARIGGRNRCLSRITAHPAPVWMRIMSEWRTRPHA